MFSIYGAMKAMKWLSHSFRPLSGIMFSISNHGNTPAVASGFRPLSGIMFSILL